MKVKNIIFKDLKSVTSGFLSTFSSMKNEIDRLVHSRVNRILNSKGFVSREDFHALEDRFDKLEMELNILKKKNKKK